MGQYFSKSKTDIRTSLFTMEEKITKLEGTYKRRKKMLQTYSFKLNFLLFTSFSCLFVYFYLIEEFQYFLFLYFLPLFFLKFIFSFFLFKILKKTKNEIENLKKNQKKNVEILKNEKNFLKTKNLFEKYSKENEITTNENENLIDKVADIVLGKDKENYIALICCDCYSHNGLLYLEDLKCFICKDCGFKNERYKKNI